MYELIRNDVFKIEDTEKFDFLLALIDNPHPQLRYAIIALVSIVSSTLRGVEYLIFNNNMVVIQRIIKVLLPPLRSSNNNKIAQFYRGSVWLSCKNAVLNSLSYLRSSRMI